MDSQLISAPGGADADPPSRRFRPEQRLRASADFTALLEAGHRYNDAWFVIYYRANAVDGARLGLAVSKRVARKATRRNQLKRLIRETFRGVSRGLPSLDIFVLLKPLAATVDCEDLRGSVARAFSRLNANQARPSKTRKR
ncbi:MAG: ribonuclease P protein component [Proteobacteria bacterium]|nr:ribonuclease P protein component [Pseudomonadota bacterium]